MWLELNSNFDLKLYVINRGDEIFVPTGMWPNYPTEQKIRKTLAWVEINLMKESQMMQLETCNDTISYVYGGKNYISNIFCKY